MAKVIGIHGDRTANPRILIDGLQEISADIESLVIGVKMKDGRSNILMSPMQQNDFSFLMKMMDVELTRNICRQWKGILE